MHIYIILKGILYMQQPNKSFTTASLEEWRTLYDLGKQFKTAKPWEWLWNTDIICIRYNEDEECYASILGNGGMEYGLFLTTGPNAAYEMHKILYTSANDAATAIMGMELNCINLFISSKEEVPNDQYQLIKDLGLSYKGKNWIYFETYEGGYSPYICSKEEVKLLTKYLKKLLEVFPVYKKIHKDNSPFTDKVFVYECNGEIWENHFEEFSISDFSWKKTIYTNQIHAAKLAKKKASYATWEFGMFCPNTIITDDKFKKPALCRLSIAADSASGEILMEHTFTSETTPEDVLESLANTIDTNGKPRQIVASSPYSQAFLEDFCEKTNITLKIDAVPAVNQFLLEMNQQLFSTDEDDLEEQIAEMENLLTDAGFDLDELKEQTKRMTYSEFADTVMPDLLQALDSMFSENDFEDEFEDNLDFSPSFTVSELKGRKQKLNTIHKFYGKCDILYEDYEMIEKEIDYDYSDLSWTAVLKESSKEDLLTLCDQLNLLVSTACKKDTLISMIQSFAYANPKKLQNILSSKELKLLKRIYKRANKIDSAEYIEDFCFCSSDIIKLLTLGLIDIGFLYSEDSWILLLMAIDGLERIIK